MSCPMLEPKLSASVTAKASISVTSAVTAIITTTNSDTSVTTNNNSNSMSYPYKKRVRDEFEKRQREMAQEQQRLELLAQAEQQLQLQRQQEHMQWQQRLLLQQQQQQQQQPQQQQQQQQQQKKQQPKKQQLRQKYKLQPGISSTSASAVITTSGNVPDEVGTSGISRPELPSAEMPRQQLRDDESDIAEEEAEETSSDDSESSGSTNWSDLDQAALEAKACCCLATMSGGKAFACGRPAFGIWFSNKLRQKALKKNLPFAYNKGRGHWYTCLFHYRVIMHEPKLKPNESYAARDLTKYLATEITEDEFQAFKNDPLTRSYMKDFEQLMAAREMQKKKKKKKGRAGTSGGDAETSEDEAPNVGVLTGIWPFMSTDFHTMKPDEEVNASASGEGATTSAPPQVPFHALSATTLRRYKKYFNLPHRSSTNTKQQLLDGIPEHFETIDAPAFETIAHFLHVAKMHKNKLDYPTGDS
uniref:Histone deacetylase complex subunit SAP30 Sin3 binding domain-containing protein n=1 Tax=Setaria digitata TaxID=48799 RepID=A0A915PL52_9BILA